MIMHLAIFKWRDGVTAEQVDSLTATLKDVAAGIPELRSYECGANLGLRPGGLDYGVAAVADDEEGLLAYLNAPTHLAVYDSHLNDMVADRHSVQLEV